MKSEKINVIVSYFNYKVKNNYCMSKYFECYNSSEEQNIVLVISCPESSEQKSDTFIIYYFLQELHFGTVHGVHEIFRKSSHGVIQSEKRFMSYLALEKKFCKDIGNLLFMNL